MRTLFIGDLMITFGEGENFARIFAMGVGSHHVCGFCRTVRFMFINRAGQTRCVSCDVDQRREAAHA